MLLKTILFFCLFGYFNGVLSKEADMETSPTNVKEITVSIEHNSDDGNSKTNDDPKKNTLSKRTRANLLLNSKVVYPPGAKSASAFNQGILKFQQLLELPLNNTKEEMMELRNNGIEEAFNNSAEVDSESKNATSTDETETKNETNCGNSTLHRESESSLKILKNKFIEDFGTSGEKILNLINNNGVETERNETEISDGHPKNKSEEVEVVDPVNLKPNNLTVNGTDYKKGSLEILDDDMEDASNSTDSNSYNATGTQSTYLPAERKSSDSKIVEVKPQQLQEIPLDLNLKNSARKEDREDDKDDVSLNIKRDILLGNLNPFFSNPSTNSIRNTNSIFFDDMIKKSGGLIGPMNPFVINSISFSGSRPGTSNAPAFSRLQAAPAKSSGSVKTVKSIALSEDSSSSSFGSKLGGHSSSFGGLSSSLGGSSSSLGGSSSSLGGSFGGHSSNIVQSSRSGHVRGRRPNYSRFRNKPSKSTKATSVETVPSIHVGDGKKSTSFNFGASPSYSSQKSSVKTVPSLLIREEEDSPKYSSRYQNKAPSAVSSASFTFTPGVSKTRKHGRTKSVSSYSKPRVYSTTSSYSKPLPSPKKSSGSEEGFEILKSVDYSLPEEVGKSLTKTGPAKFKRKAGFEATPMPNYSMQASVTVDPLMVNFDMTRKAQDDSINAYMVNTQMKPVKRNAEKSRSFSFRPSAPDSKTRQMREFNQDLQKKTFFQPSIQFQTVTELPEEEDMFDLSDNASEDEKVDNIQIINNLDGNMLFKPFFLSQTPQTFHMKRVENNERVPRSFDSSNFNSQLPRSFQMADPSTYRYFGNVHMIDLS